MKSILKVIAVLLIFIFGIIIIDNVFVKDKQKEVETETIEFQLSFLINNLVGEYEVVEFKEEEKRNIAKSLSDLNYSKVDVKLAYLGDYKIIFDDKELIFDNNDDPYGQIVIDGEAYTINVKNLKETVLAHIENKNLLRVYLYERKDATPLAFSKINLTDADKATIKESFDKIRPLEETEFVNLVIMGRYNLIVDNERIYFDDLGYAMHYDEMVWMETELIEVLKKYINEDK